MAYSLPELGYAYDALEPHIDAKTMEIHHSKHHQTYITNANAALEGTEWADTPVEELIANLDALPEDKRGPLRNNAGGHANHSLFWTVMSPKGGGNPVGDVAKHIDSDLGGFDAFKEAFTKAALTRFGSGWAWLSVDKAGTLKVESSANQDNPLMKGLVPDEDSGTPLLCLDVWEHAYYLHYQNRRADYISAWWNVVNWEAVDRRLG